MRSSKSKDLWERSQSCLVGARVKRRGGLWVRGRRLGARGELRGCDMGDVACKGPQNLWPGCFARGWGPARLRWEKGGKTRGQRRAETRG
eukprot:2526660-Rhodomonas_salina.1